MILHICNDEKFIDFAIEQFEEVYPHKNKFVVISDKSSELSFIKKKAYIETILDESSEYYSLLKNIKQYEFVVLHYLDAPKLKIIEKCPSGICFVWMFWGQDAQKIFIDISYKSITQRMAGKIDGVREILWPYTNKLRRLIFPFRHRYKLMNRIQYCVPVIPEEFYQMRTLLNLGKIRMLEFNYGSIETIIPPDIFQDLPTGENILIGNSGTLACNHLDTFNMLKNINIGTKRLVVPLSYGNKKYINSVVKSGQISFPDNFFPITEFMSLHEYVKTLRSCSIVIMDHLRQQALGNIQISMWIGAKIFLNQENPLYDFFVKRGYIVYSIKDDLIPLGNLAFEKLPENLVQINRKNLIRDFGHTTILAKTRNLINFIKKQRV